MLRVHTARIGNAFARRDDAIDITRATGIAAGSFWSEIGGLAFAPSQKLFQDFLKHRRAETIEEFWPAYQERYVSEMEESRGRYPETWSRLLLREQVILLCYCENALRCHRYLLGSVILPPMGATYEGELT